MTVTTELIERRRRLGQDRLDEVWDAVYHVAPDPRVEHGLAQLSLGVAWRAHAAARGLH